MIILTTRLPMIMVNKKNGTQAYPDTFIHIHMDSIHSPHKTRNTIMNECKKVLKPHLGSSPSSNSSLISYLSPNNCCPMTAKMNTMMPNTSVRLPRAPIVPATIPINIFKVGQDFASLNTRSCNRKTKKELDLYKSDKLKFCS